MASDHILRISRSDSEGGFVLLNISSNGSRFLDLKILATEGENPYITTIRHSRIHKLRDKRSQLDEAQWEALLLSSLLHERPEVEKKSAVTVEKLEIVATIAGETLAIHFRNNISGITQKLGEILLKQDDAQEIDAISWAGTAVLRSTHLEAEVGGLTIKYDEQAKTMENLNKQLEDLILAKQQHENALLEKFRELLNEKKIKIRDQQRLLKGYTNGTADPESAKQLKTSRQTSKSYSPIASRAKKRKGKNFETAHLSSEEEDSFEPKAPTRNPRPVREQDGDASEHLATPDISDQDETESESDDDLDSAPQPMAVDESTKDEAPMQVDEPPPARVLPFGKSDASSGKGKIEEPATGDHSMLNQEAGNEDEETDDDEL